MMNEATPWVKTTDLRETYLLEIVPADIPRGVNLEVKKSDFLAISGSSGSGKSTLLNLIGALDNPSDGKILIEDLDASPSATMVLTPKVSLGAVVFAVGVSVVLALCPFWRASKLKPIEALRHE